MVEYDPTNGRDTWARHYRPGYINPVRTTSWLRTGSLESRTGTQSCSDLGYVCKGPWVSLTSSVYHDRPGSPRRPKSHQRGSPSRRGFPSLSRHVFSHTTGNGLLRGEPTLTDDEGHVYTRDTNREVPSLSQGRVVGPPESRIRVYTSSL